MASASQASPNTGGALARASGVFRGAGRLFGAAVLISAGSSLYAKWKAWQEYVSLPPAFYLEVDLEQQVLVERASSSPLSLIAAGLHQLELQSLIQALHTAKTDERVRGLMAVLGGRENFGGIAQLQELRNALLDFRFHAKGRAPVFAYSNTFGEGGTNGTAVYYLASAADRVFAPPTAHVSLLGFETTQVFVRGLLDRLKVEPEVFRREEYKAALAPLTNAAFDQAHRENLTSLLKSLYGQVVEGVASARRLAPAAVESAINQAPLLAGQAVSLGLLDGALYRDEVDDLLLKSLPPEAQERFERQRAAPQPPGGRPALAQPASGPRVSLQRYVIATAWAKQKAELLGGASGASGAIKAGAGAAEQSEQQPELRHEQQQQQQQRQAVQRQQQRPQGKPLVALVTAAGPIVQSAGGAGAAGGENMVDGNKLVRALRAMRENPQVKAVVLRINSPGGSAVASDNVAREVSLLRRAGKPVVAVMGDVAASGGFYIAAPADKILAQPGTVTGSIGVIFGKFKLRQALEEYGVTADSVSLGDNATWASPFHSLTPKQLRQVDSMIDATYSTFLSEVSRGRRMDLDSVRRVAKGRVWSGSQAVEIGLVDELGGVSRAMELARQLAGLPEDPAATQTVEWPPRRVPPLVLLLKSAGMLPGGSQDQALLAPAAVAPPATGALPAVAALLGLFLANAWLLGGGAPGALQQQLALALGAGLGGGAGDGALPPQPALEAAARAALLQDPLMLLQQMQQQQQQRRLQGSLELVSLEAPLLAYSC